MLCAYANDCTGRFSADSIKLYYIIYLNPEIVHHQGEKEKKKGEKNRKYVKNIKKQYGFEGNNE
jgi:hypothetical protein